MAFTLIQWLYFEVTDPYFNIILNHREFKITFPYEVLIDYHYKTVTFNKNLDHNHPSETSHTSIPIVLQPLTPHPARTTRRKNRELQAEIAASDRRRANKRSIRFPVCDPAAKRIGKNRFPPITGAWNDYHEPDETRGSENDSFERLSRYPRRLSWNVISRYSRHDIPLTRDARL